MKKNVRNLILVALLNIAIGINSQFWGNLPWLAGLNYFVAGFCVCYAWVMWREFRDKPSWHKKLW